MIALLVVLLAGWIVVGAVVAVIVGRIIAFGQHPFAERLAEVEADARDAAPELFV